MRPLIKNLDPSTACPFLSPGRGPLWRKKHAMWLAVEEQGDDDDSLGGFYQSAGMVNRCFIPGDSSCSSLDVSTRNPGHCASVARSAYGMRMRMRSKQDEDK